MSDVKVTPTEARHLAERVVSRTRGYDIKLRDDDSRIAMITDALDAARLQGWNECREVAAAMIERAVEGGYPTPAEKADQCEHGKFGWEDCIACYDEVLIETAGNVRNLTPSTPESDHVE